MVSYAVLSIALLLVIIIYWIYLVYKKNNIEGFELNVQTLIESVKIKKFNIRVWDNQSYLIDLYPGTSIPVSYEECKNKTRNLTSACPLSIWRPVTGTDYVSIGDVMTRNLTNPINENVTDVRLPRKPGLINEKPLDSLGVKGDGIVSAEDFQYVGGFGTGKIADRLEKGEKYFRLLKQIKFQMNLLITELNKKTQGLIAEIQKSKKDSLDVAFSMFISLASVANYQPLTITAKTLANEILEKQVVSKYNNFLRQIGAVNFTTLNPNSFYYNITKKTLVIDNLFLIKNLLNDLPENIKQDMLNNVQIDTEFKGYSIDYYEIALTNLSFISPEQLRYTFGTNNNYYINEPLHDASDVYYHSLVITPPNVKFKINYNYLNYDNTTPDPSLFSSPQNEIMTGSVNIGKIAEKDQLLFSYHTPLPDHPKTTSIIDLTMSINDGYMDGLSPSIFENSDLISYNNSLVTSVNEVKAKYKDVLTNGYKQLSIWKPIPPIGYVALGYVFTNDSRDNKPNVDSIACLPKSCVKTFKRRKWDSEEDMIFRYSDGAQQLAFYRNPYLGTIVVVDEKMQNGYFGNKTPDNIPYRNEKDSLNWDCFDIIPCIKESTYVDDLIDATNKSKQMCKAYKGMENIDAQNDEIKKSNQYEETKMKKLIHEKDNYIKNLMGKLNTVMTEEELYKLLNQGLNRYKLRRKLEEQRKIHGAVADKLMSTRGLEITSNTPGDMSKFKDLLQRLIVAQYTKQDVNATKGRECPVCNKIDTEGMVRVKDTEMCFGCTAEAVREISGLQRPT
jgi:hypothetical protein